MIILYKRECNGQMHKVSHDAFMRGLKRHPLDKLYADIACEFACFSAGVGGVYKIRKV